MSKATFHIDSFSGSVASLPKGQRTADAVVRALRTDPRISTFDLSEYRWLRDIIGGLTRDGSISAIAEPYPWMRYVVNVKDEK